MKTEKIVAAMRCSYQMPGPELDCRTCPYHMEEGDDYAGCDCGSILADAVDRLEELVDRCARYAEEIAVLRERGSGWPSLSVCQKEMGTICASTRLEKNGIWCFVRCWTTTPLTRGHTSNTKVCTEWP